MSRNNSSTIGLINISQCYDCARYNPDSTALHPQCTAYKDIPIIIFTNLYDHRNEYKGDGGKTYKPLNGEAGILNSKRWRGILPEWLKMQREILAAKERHQ